MPHSLWTCVSHKLLGSVSQYSEHTASPRRAPTASSVPQLPRGRNYHCNLAIHRRKSNHTNAHERKYGTQRIGSHRRLSACDLNAKGHTAVASFQWQWELRARAEPATTKVPAQWPVHTESWGRPTGRTQRRSGRTSVQTLLSHSNPTCRWTPFASG